MPEGDEIHLAQPGKLKRTPPMHPSLVGYASACLSIPAVRGLRLNSNFPPPADHAPFLIDASPLGLQMRRPPEHA